MTIYIWEALLLILQHPLSFARKVAALYCWAKLTLLKGEFASKPLKVEFWGTFYSSMLNLPTLNFIRHPLCFWDYDIGSCCFATYLL